MDGAQAGKPGLSGTPEFPESWFPIATAANTSGGTAGPPRVSRGENEGATIGRGAMAP